MSKLSKLSVGLCHWDGYETDLQKGSLLKGSLLAKNIGSQILKIYAGNKYKDSYDDLKHYNDINSLLDLIKKPEYTSVFNIGFPTIVIVAFSINKSDDYWRFKGPSENEYLQFKEVSNYLNMHFPVTEFILSNWESDCVLEIYSKKEDKIVVADNIVKLINTRHLASNEYSNIKIALEVNKYNNAVNSFDYIIPKVNCSMISYSCYETLWQSPTVLDNAIKYIKQKMKKGVELYIGEFGFPIYNIQKDVVSYLLDGSINVFKHNNIRLAYYWNLYNNEKNSDGSFNGFGVIDVNSSSKTYICDKLFNYNSSVILVRHAESKANKWKMENNSNYINSTQAKLHNLYNPELTQQGIMNIKNTKMQFWDKVIEIASNRPIIIYLSPLKRTIQTLLFSISGSVAKYYASYFKNITVYITPLICETGKSCENLCEKIENLDFNVDVIELKNLFNEIKYLHFDKYQEVMTKGSNSTNIVSFVEYIKHQEKNECIVCFTHWGVINTITGKHTKNFGIGDYYVLF